MPRVPIDDLDDPRIAVYRQLKRTNLTRGGEHFIVEGEKLLCRLLESRYPVASVLVTDRHEPRLPGAIPDEVIWYVLPHRLIAQLVGYNFHLGVLGCGVRRPGPTWEEVAAPSGRRTLVICPKLANPENLGSILRLADVFGVSAVLAGPECPEPLSRRVLRVSTGTALFVPTVVVPDPMRMLESLRSDLGYERVAAVADAGAEPLPSYRRPDRIAVLLGNEAHGLGPEWLDQCDRRVTIPMRPGAESLNVAVAAGIILYHLTAPGPDDRRLHERDSR